MTTSPATRRLAVVRRSAAGLPQTYRVELAPRPAQSRDAAYRRLAATLLRLDVPTLAYELRQARTAREMAAA
jgi:hypothetical protein